MRTSLRAGLALLVLVAAALPAQRARACGTCSVGDPTLTAFGAGLPARHRGRAVAALRTRRETVTEGAARLELRERRLELGLAWAPSDRWVLSALVPVVHQRVTWPNLAEERRWGLGDAALQARGVLWRDRGFAPAHVLSGLVGLELPTASDLARAEQLASDDAQPGSRSWDPTAGLAYAFFGGAFSLQSAATLLLPLSEGFGGRRPGPTLRLLALGQWQPHEVIGFRLGATARVDGRDRVDGARDARSGGALVKGTAGLLLAPHPRLLLEARASLPVWQERRGGHEDGFAMFLGGILELH